MEKLKSFLNSYFWLVILAFVCFIGTLVFLIASRYQEQSFNKTITIQQSNAGKAKSEAANAERDAAGFDVSRRTEDVIREKTIAPKLREARRRSNNSKLELEKARKTYNEKKNNTSNLSVSDADNCQRLKQLFPNVIFSDCQ